jgi:hypothetical protein
MSTYYALCCDQCHTMTALVKMGGLAVSWMAEAVTHVPTFIGDHRGHLEALHIIEEHNPLWASYSDEDEDKDDPDELIEPRP